MNILSHFIVSSAIAALLYPMFGWEALLVFFGGVFIDIDHYLLYALKFKKISPVSCHRFFSTEAKKNNFRDVRGALLIFHSAEFLLAAALLSFYSEFALVFTIGLLPHYIMDMMERYFVFKQFITAPSIIWWLAKKGFKRFK